MRGLLFARVWRLDQKQSYSIERAKMESSAYFENQK